MTYPSIRAMYYPQLAASPVGSRDQSTYQEVVNAYGYGGLAGAPTTAPQVAVPAANVTPVSSAANAASTAANTVANGARWLFDPEIRAVRWAVNNNSANPIGTLWNQYGPQSAPAPTPFANPQMYSREYLGIPYSNSWAFQPVNPYADRAYVGIPAPRAPMMIRTMERDPAFSQQNLTPMPVPVPTPVRPPMWNTHNYRPVGITGNPYVKNFGTNGVAGGGSDAATSQTYYMNY